MNIDLIKRDGPEPRLFNAYALDPKVRPWYVVPTNAHETAWSDPFVWVGGDENASITVGISFGEPIHDSD